MLCPDRPFTFLSSHYLVPTERLFLLSFCSHRNLLLLSSFIHCCHCESSCGLTCSMFCAAGPGIEVECLCVISGFLEEINVALNYIYRLFLHIRNVRSHLWMKRLWFFFLIYIWNVFSSMLLYLHVSLEWMVLFLPEGLGSLRVEARSTAYEILK